MALKIVEPRQTPQDEGELIAACIRGDRAAERMLFAREYPRVNATVYRLLGATRETDDLVQETFIAVFRALPKFRGESKLSTWIDRIAVRVVFQFIGARKRQPIPLEFVPERENADGNPRDRAAARDGLRRLYAALSRLKPEARMAFALYAIDGRSIAEVARLTGTSTVTAKVRIWRARRDMAQRAASDPVLAEYLAEGREP
ncbi:MAG: polymerase sigma factor RpoE [Myxococcales bacterium]|nr:polymerase sigma factor RpoE [Myxococcales bacterium]